MATSRDDFVIAIRSAFLKKETKQRFSLLGLIFFSIIFLILGSFNFKAIELNRTVIREIIYFSSFIISGPEKFIKTNFVKISAHFYYFDEYKRNKSELEELKAKNLSNQITSLENIKYKKLINDYFIKDNELYAKVLIDQKSPFLRSAILNKGSKNNVRLGMIVLDKNYLIGKIVEVNYFTSRVLLLSDINSKIPVILSPGDIQAIMSGNGNSRGVLQYVKGLDLKSSYSDLLVTTSGAGGMFKGGIPIGKMIVNEDNKLKKEFVIEFYRDFSQLKYVKVISYSKENTVLDQSSKKNLKKIDNQINEANEQKENLRILLEQKKINEEVRNKIEEENIILKDKIFKLNLELSLIKKALNDNEILKEEKRFMELNILHTKKCKKTFFNNLYKMGTPEYTACILSKGEKN